MLFFKLVWTLKDKCDVLRLYAYKTAETKEKGIILTKF